MHMFSGVVMASTIALCLGCSREIDGSSEVQFADSTGLVGHEVAFEERVEYQQALAVVQGKYGLDRASLAKALLEQSEQRCDSLKDQRKQDDPQSPGPSIRESLACRSVEHYERLLDNLEDMSAEQYRDADKTAISSMRLR